MGTDEFHSHGAIDVDLARLEALSCEEKVQKSTTQRFRAAEEARDRHWNLDMPDAQNPIVQLNVQIKEVHRVTCTVTVRQQSNSRHVFVAL